MSEPEDLVIDAAEYATSVAVGLWKRNRPRRDSALTAAQISRRLELLLAALFDETLSVACAAPPPPPSLFARIFGAIPAHLVERRAMPTTDGRYVRLPSSAGERREEEAIQRFQLWAAAQALRATRRSAESWDALASEPARALFWIAEAAACGKIIAEICPGWVEFIALEREKARSRRPAMEILTVRERAVELYLRRVLEAPPAHPPAEFPRHLRCQALCRWARNKAKELPDGRWRGLPMVQLWGKPQTLQTQGGAEREAGDPRDLPAKNGRDQRMERRPEIRQAEEGEDDEGQGSWMMPIDDYHESVQDPMGLQRPADRDEHADLDDLADSLSNLERARLVITPEKSHEVLNSDDPIPAAALEAVWRRADGVYFPEWDWRAGAYIPKGALVQLCQAPAGSAAWVKETRARHRTLIRRVRRCFVRLRPRRVRLRRQLDGDEIDLAAYVESHADRRAGLAPSERVYQSIRPRRRDAALSLLVDCSASTDSWVVGKDRIIDVEKQALLVLCEALDALGDPYAISAFSGRGPLEVSVQALKRFDESYSLEVSKRISALHPDRYTRMGAALRHASAELAQRPARHRLLLVLSDGKPNDFDRYEGKYGVEDTRQAVAEARLQGLDVFCLTVDRRAPAYLPRIMGAEGFAVLGRPELLPRVLVDIVRRLLVQA